MSREVSWGVNEKAIASASTSGEMGVKGRETGNLSRRDMIN